jgi:hypothetical protein
MEQSHKTKRESVTQSRVLSEWNKFTGTVHNGRGQLIHDVKNGCNARGLAYYITDSYSAFFR